MKISPTTNANCSQPDAVTTSPGTRGRRRGRRSRGSTAPARPRCRSSCCGPLVGIGRRQLDDGAVVRAEDLLAGADEQDGYCEEADEQRYEEEISHRLDCDDAPRR